MDEGGGLNAYDVSGNNWHGTLTGGPTWDNGRSGPAINFDGTNDYIALPDRDYVIPELTVSVWTNEAETGVLQPFVTQWTITGAANRAFEMTRGSDNKYNLDIAPTGAGDVWFTTDSGYTDVIGVWHHIVGVWRGTTPQVQTMYRDGIQLAGTVSAGIPTTMFNSTYAVHIGVENLNDYYKGKLDDIRIYNRALGPGEIQSLYLDPFLEFRPVAPMRRVRAAAAQARVFMQTYRQRRI